MSRQMLDQVWKHSRATDTALLVMLRLAHFADEGGYAFRTIPELAADCRCRDRWVQEALHWLACTVADCRRCGGGLGEIQIERGAGRGGTNRYRIMPPPAAMLPVEPGAADNTPPVQSNAPQRCSGQHPSGAVECTPAVQSDAPRGAAGNTTPVQSSAQGVQSGAPKIREGDRKGDKERDSAPARDETLAGELVVIEEEDPEPVESPRAAFEALGGRCTSFPNDWPTYFLGLTGSDVRAICATIPDRVLPTLPSAFGRYRTAWEAGNAQRKLADEADRRAAALAARIAAEQATAAELLAEIDARPDFVAGLDAVRRLEYADASGKVRQGRADSLAIYYLRQLVERLRARPALRLVGAV